MVNFIYHFDQATGCPDVYQTFLVFLCRCLRIRLTLKWIDRLKQIVGCNVGGLIQSAEVPVRTKRQILSQVRENSYCQTAVELAFSWFWILTRTWALPDSWVCQSLDWNYTMGSSGSLAYQLTQKIWGLRWVKGL